MDAGRERHMVRLPAAMQVEYRWLRIRRRITIRSGRHDHDHPVARDDRAFELEIGVGHPHGGLHRRVEAQRLLDHSTGQPWVRNEFLPPLGVGEQDRDPVADQVHRRLEAGDQQQLSRGERVVGGRQPLRAGPGDHREHVVAWLCRAFVQQTAQQPSQLLFSGPQFSGLTQRAHPVERLADDGADPGEAGGVDVRNPEQRGDHGDREGSGELAHQVDASLAAGPAGAVEGIVEHAVE